MTFTPTTNITIRRTDSLGQEPELASHFAIVINLWSEMELRLMEIFALLAGTDSVIATELFTAIESDGARKGVFQKMAQDKISPPLKKRLTDIFRDIRDGGEFRNSLAHGIWGTSPDEPEALFYTDAKEWLKWQSNIRAAEADGDGMLVLQLLRHGPVAIGHRKDDFEDAEQSISKLTETINQFRKDLASELRAKRA